MADPVEGTEQPVQPDLDALVSKLTADLDKRFSGFQGLLDRRDSEYRQMLEDLKTADLSPEEREQEQASRLKTELEQYKRKVEILNMRKDFPEEVDLLTALLEGQSLQDQLSLLAKFRKVEAAAKPQEGDNEEQPTPVDGNNAPRRSSLSLADAATKMNKELSEKILNDSNEPGILGRLRRTVAP